MSIRDLRSINLLQRYGNFSKIKQQKNFNNLIWEIIPRTTNFGAINVQMAAYTATCVFNEGTTSISRIMHAMQIFVGASAQQYVAMEDGRR